MPPSLPYYATLTYSSTSTCPSLPDTLHMDSGDFFPTHQVGQSYKSLFMQPASGSPVPGSGSLSMAGVGA